ncbi:hypothetical protein SMD11_5610 [Streptomyces albireticuli]|uniref:DNA polymerase III beta sliding clamp central domain-containing protein n=1 Tax=Streptomyces albireticuli TaxID=1940 RepID=A0A1Z2LA44_9ACTN|nr:hypothetical protein [Streptomyces albireticuli]ARZ71189.1 hypothetical protein SMD11_5610 [Streptomyces albireticuli]
MTIELTGAGFTGLRTAVARVLPHMATDWPWGGLVLEADRIHLYAVATERHTLAIGRAEACHPTQPWRAHIEATDAVSMGRFLDDTDPRDAVTLTHDEYGEDGGPVLHLRSRHATLAVPLTGSDHFPDWRQIAAKALEEPPSKEPVCFTLHMLQRWAAVGERASFSHRGAHRAVVVTADDFLGLHMPCRTRTAPTPALDQWRQAITDTRKETDMPEINGLAAELRDLAATFRARADESRARERQERERRERADIRERAVSCMDCLFPETLGLILAPEAWHGYPGGQEGPGPVAVAHLGDGMFLAYECRHAASDDPWGSTFDVVVLLRPCSCGNYVEITVDSDYSLALATLGDAQPVITCVGTCTPSGDQGED